MISSALFYRLNIVPRWIIFTLDLIIGFLSLTVSYAIKYSFDFSNLNYIDFSRNALIITVLNAVVFFAVKTYSGIIRYTSVQDSFRIFLSVLVSNSSFFLINLVAVASVRPTLIASVYWLLMLLHAFYWWLLIESWWNILSCMLKTWNWTSGEWLSTVPVRPE